MIEEKEKNDFAGMGEFLLDPRHKAFVAGKSTKLYWSRENNELSILSVLMLISGFCGVTMIGWGAWEVSGDAYIFEHGAEISASITSCKAFQDSLSLNIEFSADGQNYQESVPIFQANDCLDFPIDSLIQIRYIDPTDPLPTVNQRNYRWELAYQFSGCTIIYFLIFVGFGIHELRNLRKFRRLEREGIILDGQLHSCEKDLPHQSRYVYTYKFQNPSGKWLQGKRKKSGAILPEAGTPVNILYADDDCHMLL